MPTMGTLPKASSGQLWHDHHPTSFEFPSTASHSFQPSWFYLPHPPSDTVRHLDVEPTSPSPPSSELTILPPKQPPCPLCRGQKWGFTFYFHNKKIFSEPPHDLLALVERSYVLRNRLKSLLVTYAMREIENDCIQDAQREIEAWEQQIDELGRDVVASVADFRLELGPLDGVQVWTGKMMRQIQDSVFGVQKMEISNGKLNALLVEFKKTWEAVWKGYLIDRKNARLKDEGISLLQDQSLRKDMDGP